MAVGGVDPVPGMVHDWLVKVKPEGSVYEPYRTICCPVATLCVVFVMSVPFEPPSRILGVTVMSPAASATQSGLMTLPSPYVPPTARPRKSAIADVEEPLMDAMPELPEVQL